MVDSAKPALLLAPGHRRVPARTSWHRVVWVLVGVAVAVQIAYPLTPDPALSAVTAVSVAVFALASVLDAARCAGVRGAVALLVVAGAGGMAAEAVGLRTGIPFGDYAYTGTLGPELFDVPVVVGLAWTMMAWPALVVARTLVRSSWAVPLVGGWALAAWDVFLDPQMVAAGHWVWSDPDPALPLLPGIPATNFAGWLVVSVVVVGVLHRLLPERSGARSGPATALYLWVYASSVLAHLAFFALPGSAVAGAVVMGLVALPLARTLWSARTTAVRS